MSQVLVPRPIHPATVEDLWRLAALAHERGLRVFETPANHWWCTSHSEPFRLHCVTAYTCDCVGFPSCGRCMHHALLLDHLGWLPELPDDDLSTTVDTPAHCSNCSGGGVIVFRSGNQERCPQCGGSGVTPDHRLTDVPSVEIAMSRAA
jgi:hypothetical protein